MGANETRRAIAEAAAAFVRWSKITGRERAHRMRALYDLIVARQDELAMILTLEQGKPIGQARAEIIYGASYLEWYAEEAPRVRGEVLRSAHADKEITISRQPIGVTAAITPWNFPFVSVTRKLAPALAAGCTQVLKPAPTTPLTALALAALTEQADLPAGVFNVVTGDAQQIGGELTSNSHIRFLTFTGSTAIGKLLYRQCSDTVKKLSLELGGHAPFIVFEDADLDAAVDGLIACKFRNMGQVCIAASRVYVQERVFETFVDKLAQRVGTMSYGPGVEDRDQGPLANRPVFERVDRHVTDARARGAYVVTGGSPHPLGGLFYPATLLTGVPDDAAMLQEETFGPVLCLASFKDEADAIARANSSAYGLAGYFYSRDHARVGRVAAALECGIVGVNVGVVGSAAAPFGGMKESGLGREGGTLGLDEFLEVKYVCSPA